MLPVGLTQGVVQVTTRLEPAAIASVKVALIIGLWTGTLVVLSVGAVKVTEGASTALAFVPRTPSLPPQPAMVVMRAKGSTHFDIVE